MRKSLCLAIVSVFVFSQCADLQKLANFKKPTAKVNNVRITGVSFDELDLAVNIGINNPNVLAISLAGLDYDFKVAGSTFIKGDQAEELRIESNASSSLALPLTINYKELYAAFNSVKNKDSTAYSIDAGLKFDLPVLGPVRVPVKHSAYLPVIKIPKLSVKSLKMNKLGFTSADLDLQIGIENPNAISFLVDKLNYNFAINGQQWATGTTTNQIKIDKNKQNTVTIPVSLNFAQVGATVINLLKGNSALNYNLSGDVGLNTSFPGFNAVDLPFDNSGQVKIKR